MKAIIFSNTMWSIYNFRLGIIKALVKKGYKIEILASRDNYFPKLKKFGFKIHSIDQLDRDRNPIKFFFLYFKILNIIKMSNPDIVLSFTVKPNIYSGLICKVLNIPCIIMITGMGYVFTFPNILTKILIKIYRIAFSKADFIFFQNKDDFKFFKLNKILKRKFMLVPGSGINIKYFSKIKYPKNKKINYLLIARNIKEKGIFEFARVAKELSKKIANIKFTYVGYIENNQKNFINKSFFLNLQKKRIISFYEHTTNIRKFLKTAHCVVLPTYREGTPKSILEAFAVGRPAIITKVIGTKQLIKEAHNGFYCKEKSASSLKNKILKFQKLPHTTKANMGNNARDIILKNYDEKYLISKYLDALKIILVK